MYIKAAKIILLIIILPSLGISQEMVRSLRGTWKFRIGDNMTWANRDHNDSSWDEIFAPSPWEDEGFNGYDG